VGGHAEGREPELQLVGVVGKISMSSGVNVHDACWGSPEHDSVTNMGAVSAALSIGVTVTLIVPACPGVSVRGSVAGATAATLTWKLGVAPESPVSGCTSVASEAEAWWVASPRYTARSVWLPPGKDKTASAWPMPFSATWLNRRLASSMFTTPAAGNPSAPATVIEALCCATLPMPATVSVVCVDTPCAFAAAACTTGKASAIPNAATNSSRRPRQFMPLTYTCSNSFRSLPAPKASRAGLTLRRTLLYPAGPHRGQSQPS
jgi:hypothetical protein